MTGWKGVTLRQLQRRIEATRVNCEFHAQLRQCCDVAQQLACSLQSQLSLINAERLSAVLATLLEKEALRFTDHDMCTAVSLANGLGAMHSQADAVFQNCEVPTPPENQAFSSAQVWQWDPEAGGEYLELVEARVAPSDFDVAVAAQDKILYMMLSEGCQPAIIDLPGGARAVKFIYSYDDDEMRSIQFQRILVGRVTIDDDRAVMCWRAVSEERGFVGPKRYQYDERGWWGVAKRGAPGSLDNKQTRGRHEPRLLHSDMPSIAWNMKGISSSEISSSSSSSS